MLGVGEFSQMPLITQEISLEQQARSSGSDVECWRGLAFKSVEFGRLVAANPSAPSDVLTELSLINDPVIQ